MKTAFLHGQVEEEIYMLKPEGFAGKKKRQGELGLQVYQISVRFKNRRRGVRTRDLIPHYKPWVQQT